MWYALMGGIRYKGKVREKTGTGIKDCDILGVMPAQLLHEASLEKEQEGIRNTVRYRLKRSCSEMREIR